MELIKCFAARVVVLAMLVAAPQCLWPGSLHAEPRVELITTDAGDAIWTRFGHIALRIIDPDESSDRIYNFGYAPFDQPDFLWGYLRGEAHFYLASEPWARVLARYERYDRTVRSRALNLNVDQAYTLALTLEVNARPENREYLYDHLRDNCSTRVRDLLDALSNGALMRTANEIIPTSTCRGYTLEAGSGAILPHIIFDMIGGPNQELDVDGWFQLYMPSRLEEAAVATMIVGPDGELVPLAGPPVILYQRQAPPATSGNLYTGRWTLVGAGLVLGLLLFLGFRVAGRSKSPWAGLFGRTTGLILLACALVFGALGLGLAGLVAVSKVADFSWNENLIVFWPTDLLWTVTSFRWLVLGRRDVGRLFRAYARMRIAVLGLLALAKLIGVMPQDNWAFMGFACLILLALSGAPRKEAVG